MVSVIAMISSRLPVRAAERISGAHDIAADHHDDGDRGEGLRERQQQVDQRLVAGAARFQDADGEQDRHHHQVLEQQHRQRHAPDRRRRRGAARSAAASRSRSRTAQSTCRG